MKRILALAGLSLLLGACGVPLSEKQSRPEGYYISADEQVLGKDPMATALEQWARVPGAYRERFGAPRVARADEASPPLGPNTVVHVEITEHPRSCSPADVARTSDIWVLAAKPRATPSFISTGPEWLGTMLRVAGVGGTVELPEPGRCDAQETGTFEGVPTRVFAQVGYSLTLHTGHAITARVIEACPAEPSLETYSVSSYQLPLNWFRSVPGHLTRERTTMRVRAQCKQGQVTFAYGPVTSASPLDPSHDPKPEVTSSVDGKMPR